MNISTGPSRPRSIFFEGDSITANGNHYLSHRVYQQTVVVPEEMACLFDYSVPGSTISDLVARLSTWSGQIKQGDILHLWIGTNDIANLGHSAATVYANLCSYAAQVRALGATIICATTIARGTDTGKETIRLSYNSLIRGGSSFVFDAVTDIGANSVFDAIADTANTTYYDADRIHLTSAGWNVASDTYIVPAVNGFL